MSTTEPDSGRRSLDRLRSHYLVERQLADRLRRSIRKERSRLYAEVYDELFRQVPDHPQLTRKADAAAQRDAVSARFNIVRPWLTPDSTFMEIGPGDCSLAIEVARRVSQVYAIDVSAEITKSIQPPPNFTLSISDGSAIPLPDATVDVAFSYQLIEHLHPVDAVEHAREVARVLKPGGVYICVTPNRLTGPHDVSRFFDEVATGFHMREYTVRELSDLFQANGFARVNALLGVRGRFASLNAVIPHAIESVLETLPRAVRLRVGAAVPLRQVIGCAVAARKAS